MRYLLDTHVWLWLQTDPDRLGPSLLHDLRGADVLLLSAASTWEIAIKYQLGKLPLPAAPSTYVPDRMNRSGVDPLAVEITHSLAAGALPRHHRDPFDRLLVAQSQLLEIPLVSSDDQLRAYGVDILWA